MAKRIDREGGGTDNPRILWVDDNSDLNNVIKVVLARDLPDVATLFASGNDEALELLRTHHGRFNLIIQDCQRASGLCLGAGPDMFGLDSGLRFHQKILKADFPRIPVIYCTGSSDFCCVPANAVVLAKAMRLDVLPDFIQSYLNITRPLWADGVAGDGGEGGRGYIRARSVDTLAYGV